MLPEIHQEMRSRKKISGHSDRLLVGNCVADIFVIVVWAGDLIKVSTIKKVPTIKKITKNIKKVLKKTPLHRRGIYFKNTAHGVGVLSAGDMTISGRINNPNPRLKSKLRKKK